MLSEMKAKGELMLQEEGKTYAAYSEWVSDQERKLGFEIKTANSDIEKLLAAIAEADSSVKKLGDQIKETDGEISTAEQEKQAATELRTKQHAEYVEISTDYSESVDALSRAIQTMQSKNYDVSQAMMLMQTMASTKPAMRRVLAAFLQDKEEKAQGGPAVAAYEFQSGGIIALLEKFSKKFKDELAEVESEESNQAHNFDLEMIHLSDTIAYMNKEHEEKSVLKAKRSSASAAAKGELTDTKADLAEDQTTLRDMKATFTAKSDTFKANQAVRKQELEAIGKAIEIISDPNVSGSYGKHINLVQAAKSTFLQMRSVRQRVSSRQMGVAQFLARKASLLSSEALKNLASQVQSNPFDKVVTMIKDLVAKLKEEAAAEAEHKAWCDEQLKTNKIKREKKTAKVNKLTATIEAMTQDIASMGKKIQTLKSEQVELTLAMSKATGVRDQEKATNADTMKEAAAGEDAVKQALVVLREFYSSQASLVQAQRQVPEMAAYKGQQSAKGGVVGMLQVIASDFSRLNADTKAAENVAATEYATFTADSKAANKEKHDL